ncbi:MAG: GLUG motif-containing protein, partial [archaeon]
ATGDVFVRNSKGGGLVGENRNSARISNSYATGNVQGDETIGGLVGVNWIQGYIENTTYSIGEVNGETEIGGFVGRQGPHGSNVDDGFWDIETSKIETSDGGIGKTTDELMSYETFEDWDISRESELDMESPTIWSIVENEEYPKLTVE